jgi:hypothetical protein
MTTKWEYKVEAGSSSLNGPYPAYDNLGEEGWELVSVVANPIPASEAGTAPVFYQFVAHFKRPLPQPDEIGQA